MSRNLITRFHSHRWDNDFFCTHVSPETRYLQRLGDFINNFVACSYVFNLCWLLTRPLIISGVHQI